jgi:chromatin remodeling complex protein RSC6
MAGYVSSFKKFMKSEEKKAESIGANPVVDEQATDAAAPATPPTTDQPEKPETAASPTMTVEADPGVQNATKTLNDLNKQLADLQKKIADANVNLSTARATAANKLATKPA